MGGDGVSDISAGAGERSWWVYCNVGSQWGWQYCGSETRVDSERLGGFRKVADGDLVRRSWVDGSEERI